MAENLTDQEGKQLEDLANELSAIKVGAEIDPCGIWAKVKPFWPIILKAARLVPGLVGILTALGIALDTLCPPEKKTSR